jgi:hypothetical protein
LVKTLAGLSPFLGLFPLRVCLDGNGPLHSAAYSVNFLFMSIGSVVQKPDDHRDKLGGVVNACVTLFTIFLSHPFGLLSTLEDRGLAPGGSFY